jgi:hypothetical protein
MNTRPRTYASILAFSALVIASLACGFGSAPATQPSAATTETPASLPNPTPTPTPTSMPLVAPPTVETPASKCASLSGEIELSVLVGPSDAVGLEPLAVGSIPFSVVSDQAPYTVQGGGPISYADTLVEEWGTYDVSMDLQTTIGGECLSGSDGDSLHILLTMTGQQLVTVKSEGFQGQYPWSGESTQDVTFPLLDGATAQGEGWSMTLHLPAP